MKDHILNGRASALSLLALVTLAIGCSERNPLSCDTTPSICTAGSHCVSGKDSGGHGWSMCVAVDGAASSDGAVDGQADVGSDSPTSSDGAVDEQVDAGSDASPDLAVEHEPIDQAIEREPDAGCTATAGTCCSVGDCTAQAGKVASCSSTHTCSYACAGGSKPCGNSCIPTDGCCADGDCAAQAGKVVSCNATSHQCDYKICGGFIMPNPASAGLPHAASYKDNGATVTDNVTGFVWEKKPSPTAQQCTGTATATSTFSAATCTQAQAVSYCAGLGTGWRVPTRLELLSIVDFTVAAPTINGAFPGTPQEEFWTSTALVATPGFAWSVAFFAPTVIFDADVTGQRRVRCVSGSGPRCYSSRFQLDATGHEVSDGATGLTWQQIVNSNNFTWTDAVASCVSPWRLPSLTELQTIVDDTRGPPIDPVFINPPLEGYWSSSHVAGFPDSSWFVDFGVGNPGNDLNSVGHRVRCVK